MLSRTFWTIAIHQSQLRRCKPSVKVHTWAVPTAENQTIMSSVIGVPSAVALQSPVTSRLHGKRVGMVVFSSYPSDPRPRRAAEALVKEGMLVDLVCEGGG